MPYCPLRPRRTFHPIRQKLLYHLVITNRGGATYSLHAMLTDFAPEGETSQISKPENGEIYEFEQFIPQRVL